MWTNVCRGLVSRAGHSRRGERCQLICCRMIQINSDASQRADVVPRWTRSSWWQQERKRGRDQIDTEREDTAKNISLLF